MRDSLHGNEIKRTLAWRSCTSQQPHGPGEAADHTVVSLLTLGLFFFFFMCEAVSVERQI